jgi:NADH:ubiquinone oxidoreductase subunit 2 (subunit N)|tara:strand:- start:4937 stop:5140 length:204 start_codon:yes stop_codon:yes gene_type:complete
MKYIILASIGALMFIAGLYLIFPSFVGYVFGAIESNALTGFWHVAFTLMCGIGFILMMTGFKGWINE